MSLQKRLWWSVLGVLLAVGLQLCVSRESRRDLSAVLCAMLIGPLADQGLVTSGTRIFSQEQAFTANFVLTLTRVPIGYEGDTKALSK